MRGKRREFLRKVAREALRRLGPARGQGGPVVPPLAVDTSRGDGASTVFYLCPDYDVASGGIRTLYRHVDLLNAAGVPAAILHTREGFRCTWFPNDTRIAYAEICADVADSSSLDAATASGRLRSSTIVRRDRSKGSRDGSVRPPLDGRSTRITSAPWSASIIPQNGPGPIPASSRMRNPARGGGAVIRRPRCR